jgi:hypothetical protein
MLVQFKGPARIPCDLSIVATPEAQGSRRHGGIGVARVRSAQKVIEGES